MIEMKVLQLEKQLNEFIQTQSEFNKAAAQNLTASTETIKGLNDTIAVLKYQIEELKEKQKQ